MPAQQPYLREALLLAVVSTPVLVSDTRSGSGKFSVRGHTALSFLGFSVFRFVFFPQRKVNYHQPKPHSPPEVIFYTLDVAALPGTQSLCV